MFSNKVKKNFENKRKSQFYLGMPIARKMSLNLGTNPGKYARLDLPKKLKCRELYFAITLRFDPTDLLNSLAKPADQVSGNDSSTAGDTGLSGQGT